MKLKEFIEENCDREIIDVEALEKCLAPKKPKTVNDITYEDTYFYFDDMGNICESKWLDHTIDDARLAMGNVFLTLEEITARKEMLMIEAELISCGGRREFKVGKNNMYLCYNPATGLIEINDAYNAVRQDIYFDTSKQAREAIATIGERKIIDNFFKSKIDFGLPAKGECVANG